MKRNKIVESLIKEGFSEKTLVKFTDKQLTDLHQRIIGEEDVMISKKDPLLQQKIANAKKGNQTIVTYEEKPSAGLSKEKKSEVVKKAKKGEDIGKKGKGFEKIEKKAEKSGAKNPKAVAAAAMWKNIKREESVEIKDWVERLAEENFHNFTSKNEIMELIQVKLNENKPAPSEPKPDAPVREKPTTKPGKPKRENPFEPKHTPKPKALKEEDKGVPEFLSFKNIGIKLKDSK